MKTRNVMNLLTAATDSPRDVLTGVPILTSMGGDEITVENFRGIIEYTDQLIRFQTRTGQYKICGTGLKIEYYSENEMKIQGHISAIQYP